MPHEKIRIALDLSDAVALIEQQQEEIAALKAEADALLKKLERSNDAWIRGQKEIAKLKTEAQELHDKYGLLWDQIAALKAENERMLEALEDLWRCPGCGYDLEGRHTISLKGSEEAGKGC